MLAQHALGHDSSPYSRPAALSSLPDQPELARAMLAAVCRRAELSNAAREFAREP